VAWLRPPAFDERGCNVLDPADRFGIKSDFVTLIQHETLRSHLPRAEPGAVAADVGCGYGRHAGLVRSLGYTTIGIDPDARFLELARHAVPDVEFRLGALPDLPIAYESCDLLTMLSLWRPLHQLGETRKAVGAARYVKPGGTIAMIENIRARPHPLFVEERTILDWARGEELELTLRLPFRQGRRLYLYLMMTGLFPRSLLPAIARREAAQMARRRALPRSSYCNVLFLFKKPG
jgi:SAM-dependent methyltransferase